MAVDLTIRQGDTTPAFTATVLDSSGNPVNLTGATVTFVLRLKSSSQPTVNSAMVIVNASAGQVEYNWSTVDTQIAGMYMAEIHVVFSDSSTFTYPNIGYLSIEVEENLLSPTQQLVTVDNVKDVLNLSNLDRVHDTKILRWINAVRPVIENLAGPIIQTMYEEWHDGGGDFLIVRRKPSSAFGTTPVLIVNAISEYNGPIEWVLAEVQTPDQGQIYSVEIDVNLGQIVRRTAGGGVQPFPYIPQGVHLWYTAGQSSVPDNVAEATLELIRQNYQVSAQAGRGRPTGASDEEPAAPNVGFFVSWPRARVAGGQPALPIARMSTSTEPSVMLALLEKFAGLTYPTLLGSNEPVYVFDGIPGPTAPDNYIQLGGTQDPAIEGPQTWAGLGATVRYEDYLIDCAVSCYVGGDADAGWGSTETAQSAAAQSDAQLSARTNAYAIFAVIESAMVADVQLQNVADPVNPRTVLWTEIIPKVTQQTTDEDPESSKGRITSIFFDVHVMGRIFP